MRVIEQLIQHFWQRGALSRAELRHLVEHRFARRDQFPASVWDGGQVLEADELLRPHVADELDDVQRGLEGRPTRPGGKKGGQPAKRRPSAERLQPLLARVAAHVAEREPYPALVELGRRLGDTPTWREAATAVITAAPGALEAALVRTLDARPRALAELWFWFDVEGLFAWADARDGAAAHALARMLRARSLHESGRATRLLRAAEMQALAALHAARRHFLAALPAINARKGDLPQLLVPPRGAALASWPRLAWAFAIAHNAPFALNQQEAPGAAPRAAPPGHDLFREALQLALSLDPAVTLQGLLTACQYSLSADRALKDDAVAAALIPILTRHVPPTWAL